MSAVTSAIALWCGCCGFLGGGWSAEWLFGKASHATPTIAVRQSSESCSQEIIVSGGSVCVFPWTTFAIGCVVVGGDDAACDGALVSDTTGGRVCGVGGGGAVGGGTVVV